MESTQLSPRSNSQADGAGFGKPEETHRGCEPRSQKLSGKSKLIQIQPNVLTQPSVQTTLGSQLNTLETRWTELISSVLQIEMANVALDAEVERLNKREAELAEMV